jgi:threonine synthase
VFVCNKCGRTYNINELTWRCQCGHYLSYESPRKIDAEKISCQDRSIWRYKEYIPGIDKNSIVSLGEGMTPAVKDKMFGFDVYLKLDYVQPTGSFKDRGATVVTSHLKQLGVNKVIEDSSGNAGASLAAYSARAGIGCRIYVPYSTSENKLIQIQAMGAEVVRIKGSRDDVANAAMSDSDGFYASHNWNPLFIEGVKSVAFEVWEQLGCAPDNVIAPLGYGSMVLGVAMGFLELKEAGIISKMPKICAIQAQNCSPMYDYYYNNGSDDSGGRIYKETIAEGIAARSPIRKEEIKKIIDESKGSISLVTEHQIMEALQLSLKRGIFIEPTSAVAVAGFKKLCDNGVIKNKDISVICLTGSGLKDLKSIMKTI